MVEKATLKFKASSHDNNENDGGSNIDNDIEGAQNRLDPAPRVEMAPTEEEDFMSDEPEEGGESEGVGDKPADEATNPQDDLALSFAVKIHDIIARDQMFKSEPMTYYH